jgi:hypothetical protein
MHMMTRTHFWLAQARRHAAIIALLLFGAIGNLSCRPARQSSLPDGTALAELLLKSELRLTGYVMASEGGYGSEYAGGIFIRSTPDRKDYYLIGMPVGGKPDVAFLGDRITVNMFYGEPPKEMHTQSLPLAASNQEST